MHLLYGGVLLKVLWGDGTQESQMFEVYTKVFALDVAAILKGRR